MLVLVSEAALVVRILGFRSSPKCPKSSSFHRGGSYTFFSYMNNHILVITYACDPQLPDALL